MARIGGMAAALLLAATATSAQDLAQPPSAAPALVQPAGIAGPFNIDFPVGGDEVDVPLPGSWTIGGTAGWSLTTWVEVRDAGTAPVLVGGIGGTGGAAYLVVAGGRPGLWDGATMHTFAAMLAPGWHLLAAVGHGGRVRLTVDGTKAIDLAAPAAFVPAQLRIAPRGAGPDAAQRRPDRV